MEKNGLPGWVSLNDQGTVFLQIWAQPGSRKSEIVGIYVTSQGCKQPNEGPAKRTGERLKVKLAAPPVEGKANNELRSFLADLLSIPQKNVSITRGENARHKTVAITGVSVALVVSACLVG